MADYKVPSYMPAHLRGQYKRVVAESRMERSASADWVGEGWMRNFRAVDKTSSEYAVKLATIRKGIANFVYIMTKMDIPVTFSTGKQSYATRDRIVISASNDPAKLDANVGVALHEAAHIILSKRSKIKESIPLYDWIPFIKNHADIFIPKSVFTEAARIGKDRLDVKKDLKTMLNVIEDRRIDSWVYANAKGYRRYYDAMYADTWNKPLVSRALVHPLGRRQVWDCYHLHIVNLTNPLHDADALPGLREIVELINLSNIARFSNDERWDWWNNVRWGIVQQMPEDFDPTEIPEMIQVAVNVLAIAYANCEHPDDMKVQQFRANNPGTDEDAEISPIADLSDDEDAPEGVETDDDEKQQVVMNPKNAKPPTKGKKTGDEDSGDDLADDKDNKDRDDKSKDVAPESDEEEGSDNRRTDTESDEDDEAEGEDDDDDFGPHTDDMDDYEEEDEDESDLVSGALDEAPDDLSDDKIPESEEEKAKAKEDEAAAKLDNAKDSDDFDNAVKAINAEQDKILDGDAPKDRVSEDQSRAIEAAQDSGAEIHEVGTGMKEKFTCIVFPKMTDSLLMAPNFSFVKRSEKYPTTNEDSAKAVSDGERLGNILAHKLKVMADEMTTQFPRQRHGKIDKRHIAGLGFGDESVFSHSVTERHKPVKLHLSIDASGSMAGEKWRKALTLAVAVAKAAEKVKMLEVTISLRGTGHNEAHLGVVYDSKHDKFGKVRRFFPYFGPYGGTPEGLCFEAVLDKIIESDEGTRNFFVNISDGAPAMWITASSGNHVMYMGENAWHHTALMVKQMQGAGVTVLSYFVGYDGGMDAEAFKKMYGRAASFIDTENVTAIATTLNRLFVQ